MSTKKQNKTKKTKKDDLIGKKVEFRSKPEIVGKTKTKKSANSKKVWELTAARQKEIDSLIQFKLTASAIARHMGVAKSTLDARFKEKYDMTLKEYSTNMGRDIAITANMMLLDKAREGDTKAITEIVKLYGNVIPTVKQAELEIKKAELEIKKAELELKKEALKQDRNNIVIDMDSYINALSIEKVYDEDDEVDAGDYDE